jgi:hypothetical protein
MAVLRILSIDLSALFPAAVGRPQARNVQVKAFPRYPEGRGNAGRII